MIDIQQFEVLSTGKITRDMVDELTTLEEFISMMINQKVIEDVFTGSLATLFGVSDYQGITCSVFGVEYLVNFSRK